MFGKAAGSILGSTIPMAGGTGAAIAGHVAATAVYTAASMSESVKSKDEITLEIKMAHSGSDVLTKQYKAKAKSDGEDIISPLIEQAAQAIVDVAAKK
jgi:outer membrane lipoprotein SlyB